MSPCSSCHTRRSCECCDQLSDLLHRFGFLGLWLRARTPPLRPAACDFAACLSGSANDHRQWPSTVLASQDSKLVHCSCCFFLPTAPCKCMQNVMQNCEDTMRCHARLRLWPIGLRTLDPCLKTTRSTCIRPKDSRGTEASRRSVQKKSP